MCSVSIMYREREREMREGTNEKSRSKVELRGWSRETKQKQRDERVREGCSEM